MPGAGGRPAAAGWALEGGGLGGDGPVDHREQVRGEAVSVSKPKNT